MLSALNSLRGYYYWVQKLDKELIKAVLGDKLRMFGEWLVPHALKYPDECYNTMYCFDVFDTENQCYLPQNKVKSFVEQLGLNYVPVFYEGEFTAWEDYMYLVGKTEMGGEIGEGIVVKNQTEITEDVVYTKIVHENFHEVHKQGSTKANLCPQSDEEKHELMRLTELAETIVTPARVEKILYKLVDEGIIPENFSMKNMQAICKKLPSEVYYDCLKEVPQIVNQIESFSKISCKIVIRLAKEIIQRRE